MSVNSLTVEQEKSLIHFRDKWIKYGLDTSPIDESRVISAVKEVYACLNLPPPSYYIFVDGPLEANRIISSLPKINLTKDDLDHLAHQGPLALTLKIREIIQKFATPTPKQLTWPNLYGQHDADWLSFYDFFREHFNLAEKISAISELSKLCGWVWTFKKLVIVSRKAIHISVNATGEIHNENKAAIEYADGTKVYAFNGVNLPEEWILNKNTIDPTEILKHSDTDVRAAGIALFGYSRLKKHLDYRIIDGDPTTDIGALVSIKIPGLQERGLFLEAICPRNGPVFLGINETNPWDNSAKINDALGAQAFLARLPRSAYEHPKIRT